MPDTIIEPADCFSQLLAFRDRHEADLTLALFPTDNPSKFGMVDMDANNDVIWTYDKPETSDLPCTWGACCWSPPFTALIGEYLETVTPGAQEVVLGDVFNHAIERKMRVKATSFDGAKYIDIGTTAELNLALQQFNL
jgi:glucose-1-phosphate thymidylyltransferase